MGKGLGRENSTGTGWRGKVLRDDMGMGMGDNFIFCHITLYYTFNYRLLVIDCKNSCVSTGVV